MYLDNMIYYVRLEADVLHLPWNSERGETLQRFRKGAKMTRAELATILIGVPNASLHQIRKLEIGKGADLVKGIDSSLFTELCKIFKISPSEFGYEILTQEKKIA